MSSIEITDNNLSPVNYEGLLKAIGKALQDLATSRNPEDRYLHTRETHFSFDVDKVAEHVALQFKNSNKFPFELRDGMSFATIYTLDLESKDTFSQQIKQLIVDVLRQQIAQKLSESQVNKTLTDYARSLFVPVAQLSAQQAQGSNYSLNTEYTLEKKRLHVQPHKPDGMPWLKAHKLTLTVQKIDGFAQQITDGICEHLVQKHCSEEDIEEVREVLEDEAKQRHSNLGQLQEILVKESVARIQRDAKVRYLRYLLKGIEEWKKKSIEGNKQGPGIKKDKQALHLFTLLIERLELLDRYIRQKEQDAGYYQVTYQHQTFNYRDLFARADAFNALPIIPEIDGFLGESTDKERREKTFVTGIKMKLNGGVHAHGGEGRSVFKYNVALLDPDSADYKKRERVTRSIQSLREKTLRTALLYCFVFCYMDDATFQPDQYFEKHILPVLGEGTEEQKKAVLKKLQQRIDTLAVTSNIDAIKDLLFNFLIQSSVGPNRSEDTLVLSLDRSILVKDINQITLQNIFFQETFDTRNGRTALKYVSVKKDSPDNQALCTLPLKMVFEPIYYYPAEEVSEVYSMAYEPGGIRALPILLAPVDKEQEAREKYVSVYKDVKRLALYYRHRPEVHSDTSEAFVYRFTYTLLSYVWLKLFADALAPTRPRDVFFPILSIHAEKEDTGETDKKYDDETFIHSLGEVLAHMLGEDFLSESQGFYVDTVAATDAYKLKNALYSLYSVLPHVFRLKQSSSVSQQESFPSVASRLKKLAIIVVSSRKCDENRKGPDYYKATVLGKVIGVEQRNDSSICLRVLSTFSENQDSKEMYTRPRALIEQIKSCVSQDYHHILYVAKAPYTSELHISDSGEEKLFFMNRDVIQAMRDVEKGLRVYPVFCDKYYAINHKQPPTLKTGLNLQADSLYIDDVGELTTVAHDRSRRSQLFFNLFSGVRVNPKAVYNGVMSYSTLINVYENDPVYDGYIWSDLLNSSSIPTMKKDLLDYLMLLHFVRYEKANQLGFKLDPYTDIIGNDSVGKAAVFPHMNGKASFNSLAFLTLVRSVLQVTK